MNVQTKHIQKSPAKNPALNEEETLRLLEQYQGLIHKAARQRHLAPIREDAEREAVFAFLRAVLNYRKETGVPFAGYAKAIVYGQMRTLFKKERRRWQREVFPADGTDENSGFWDSLADETVRMDRFADTDALKCALTELSDVQRKILFLLYEENLTQTQIAQTLGISQQAVSAAKKRALSILKNRLS